MTVDVYRDIQRRSKLIEFVKTKKENKKEDKVKKEIWLEIEKRLVLFLFTKLFGILLLNVFKHLRDKFKSISLLDMTSWGKGWGI